MLKIFLITFVALISISGCCEKVYVDREVKVKVPVKCKVPIVTCNPKDKNSAVMLANMIGCIFEYKEAVKVCQ